MVVPERGRALRRPVKVGGIPGAGNADAFQRLSRGTGRPSANHRRVGSGFVAGRFRFGLAMLHRYSTGLDVPVRTTRPRAGPGAGDLGDAIVAEVGADSEQSARRSAKVAEIATRRALPPFVAVSTFRCPPPSGRRSCTTWRRTSTRWKRTLVPYTNVTG